MVMHRADRKQSGRIRDGGDISLKIPCYKLIRKIKLSQNEKKISL